MKLPLLPLEGGCRCDRVRFRVTERPLLTSACHCRGCQRMTGSAFSLTLTVPQDGFEVIAGEPEIGGIHGPQAHHHHCGWCKSWLYTTVEPTMGFVNVRPTMLDDAGWFAPYLEVWTSRKLPWAATGAVLSEAEQPADEEYQSIVERFQAKLER